MSIDYRGGKTLGSAGQGGGSVAINSGLTGGLGAAALAGDLVVVTVAVGTAGRNPTISISTPSGYTALTLQHTTASAIDISVQTCYKIMGGTPDTTVTIPASGNAQDGIAYAIQVFTRVDGTTPMDVSATFATGNGTDNLPDGNSITPTTAGAWIVVCGGGAAGAGGTFTSGLTDFITSNGADTNDGNVGCGYDTSWTSGAFNPTKFGGGSVNAANSWGCSTLALRPLIHGATGAVVGPGATVAGSASRTAAAVTHDADGVIVGPGAAIVGTASSATTRTATGAIVGPGATLAGTASSATTRTATGDLVGPGATLSGTASSATTRTSTGALVGAGAVLDGVADRTGSAVSHTSDGVLVGPGATLAGTASSATTRTATGALVGSGATLAGTASSATTRTAAGVLAGPNAIIVGSASRTPAVVSHSSTGVLVGAGAIINGSASIGGDSEYIDGIVYIPSTGLIRPYSGIFFPTNMDY